MISPRDLTRFRGVIKKIVGFYDPWVYSRNFATKEKYSELDEYEKQLEAAEEKKKQAKLEQLRNKSGLQEAHFNIQHGQPPFQEPEYDFQKKPSYRRKMYGCYGIASSVNPNELWPSKEQLEFIKEYEAIAHPHSLPELINLVKERQAKEEEEKLKREEEVLKKVKNRYKEIAAFNARVRQKFLQALATKKKKEEIVADIRMKIGYDIDVKHEKFLEELEKREEDERKKNRDEKRAAKKEAKRVQLEKKMAESFSKPKPDLNADD